MNKRFSTLLAAALVAGGLSFNANADSYLPWSDTNPTGVKDGVNAYLKAGSAYLTLDKDGLLKTVTTLDGTNLASALWSIKIVPTTTVTGTTYAYQFTNRGTGQLLSIKLESNKSGGGKDNLKVEPGISTWGWDQTNGIYAVGKKDTTFYLDGVNMIAIAKGGATTLTTAITHGAIGETEVITMTAADFKSLVKGGKLYFNGEDVSKDQKNVLTANTWTAESYAINSGAFEAVASSSNKVLFLTNGEKVAGYDNALKATNSKKKYLVVSHDFYNAPANTLNALVVDTLSFDPVDGVVTAAQIDNRTVIGGKHHPFAAAFKAEYYIANDSIVLTSLYQPTTIAVSETIGKMAETTTYSILGGGADAVYYFGKAVKSFIAQAASAAGDLEFATATFNASYEYQNGSGTSGEELIKAFDEIVKAAKDATGATDTQKATLKAEKEHANALLAAIKGLKIVSADDVIVSDKFKEPSYVDGLNALKVTKADKEVVVRKLAETKVLTIATKGDASNLIALIQPYATKPGVGGDAEIAEGIYYVIDAKKGETTPNKYYGKYFDFNPVNPAKYVGTAQAFNPYAQFVVKKAAGVDKGNYTILNRAEKADAQTKKDWFGVTTVVDKDNKIFAIGGDTIQLVAAEGVDKDNAYIGLKYITANDAKNNKFTITSAAEMLAGQSIIMKSDSALAVGAADEEVLYTLVPSAEKKYGLDDALKAVTYTIMNADSAYIIEGTYKFSNGKHGEANGTPAKFYMIAVDTDSTFVLTDGTKKLVVSTQYKTISAEDLDARNDMFLVKPQSAPASYMSLPKHVRLNGADGNSIAINSKNQGVAVREGDELKAAYGVEDLTFWLDTAAYDNADPFKYYITRGVKATEETAASRLFMYNAVDSTVSKLNKEYYTYGTAARVIFRTAEVFVKDTLFVPTMDATAKIDTVSFAKGESADGLKHAVKAGINNFQFSFEFAGEAEGQYNIVCRDAKNANPSYVHNINGVLAMGAKEDALVVAIEDAEAPTANEGVEVSGVTVIAGNGNVTIAGAAGKKVVISNILGQTVANTVITSDNAAIAASQGVVVVAVEGEDAIKAIVK